MTPKNKKILFNIIKAVLVALIIFYLYRATNKNIDQIRNFDSSQIDRIKLLISFILIAVAYTLAAINWSIIIRDKGEFIKFTEGIKIFFLSNFFRYIPGKIMQFVSMFYLANQAGISYTTGFHATVIFQVVYFLAGIVISILFIPLSSFAGKYQAWGYIRYLAFFAVLVLYPPFLNKLFKLASKLIKKDIPEVTTSFWNLLKYWLICVVGWILNGIGFSLFVNSISSGSNVEITKLIGVYPTGYIVGYLAIIVPGGIGVREGLFEYFLTQYTPDAFLISIMSRLWITLMEVVVIIPFIFPFLKNYFANNEK